MRHQRQGYLYSTIVMAVMALLGVAATGNGAEILTGGANVAPSQVYAAGIWDIPAGTAVSASTFLAPGTLFPNTAWNYTGTIEWVGNPLVLDYSTVSGQARGQFGGGGVFKIHGSVNNQMGAPVAGYQNVDLVIGTVSGFTMEETGDNTNNFDAILSPVLTVTGGALVTGGGAAFMTFGAVYQMDVSILSAVNGNPPVNDFVNSPFFFVNGGTQINLSRIPEPATLFLLLVGSGLVALRRSGR